MSAKVGIFFFFLLQSHHHRLLKFPIISLSPSIDPHTQSHHHGTTSRPLPPPTKPLTSLPRSQAITASVSQPPSPPTGPTNRPMGPSTPFSCSHTLSTSFYNVQTRYNWLKVEMLTISLCSYKIQPNVRGIGPGRALKLCGLPTLPTYLPSSLLPSSIFRDNTYTSTNKCSEFIGDEKG